MFPRCLRVLVPAAAGMALTLAAAPALGAANPDRDNTTKTGWWYLTDASRDDILAKVNDGYRPIDIEPVDGTTPLRFTCVMVADSASFNKDFLWDTDMTEAQINAAMANNSQRLIDIEPYQVGGVNHYAFVSIANSGQDSSPSNWWIAGRTEQQVRDFATSHDARVIDVDTYFEGSDRRYAAVLVANSGSTARGWTWLTNATPAQISAALGQGQRLVQIEKENSGTWCVLLEDFAPGVNHQWWFAGWSYQQIQAFTAQYGTRLISLDRQDSVSSGTTYCGAFVNNLNAPETRARDIMDADIDDGFWGLYCKRINGSIVASLQHDRPFEPASALKLLHHFTAMRTVNMPASGVTLQTQYPYLGGGGNGGGVNQPGYDSCPNPNDPNVQQLSLQAILTRMMNPSDNEATYAITTNFGGFAMLNNVANNILNMDDTNVQHHIGCGTPANSVTLVDLGRIHEAVSNGAFSQANTDAFRSTMINGWGSDLTNVVDQEINAAGMPGYLRPFFRNQVQYAQKGGNYGISGEAYRTLFSWYPLPHKSSCVVSPREFVYGAYYNNITNDTQTGSQAAIATAQQELIREQVRAAVESWMSSCVADINQNGTVEIADIFGYLQLWFRGEGDVDGDGRCMVPDIFGYLRLWFTR